MAQIEIVKLDPGEWQTYKALRLASLLTDPQAFGSRYDDMVQRPDSYWQSRLEEAQAGDKSWLLFAREENRLIGMIGAYAREPGDVVEIISVYVAPEARGRGAADRLMAAILNEVGSKGFRAAVLTVNSEQARALALYQRFGFQVVGDEWVLRDSGSLYRRNHMEKALSGPEGETGPVE